MLATRRFVANVAERARALDPDLLGVPQSGLDLLTSDGRPSGDLAADYVAASGLP
jgi:hypothetical protein